MTTSVIAIILSVTGLAVACFGSAIVYRFGLPANLFAGYVDMTDEHMSINKKAKIGLFMVIIGLIAQFSAIFLTYTGII